MKVRRSSCPRIARQRVVFPVPMSPVMTTKPSRRRMAYCNRSNALPCDSLLKRYFGSGVKLKGFSVKP